jgi:hypothetical protein
MVAMRGQETEQKVSEGLKAGCIEVLLPLSPGTAKRWSPLPLPPHTSSMEFSALDHWPWWVIHSCVLATRTLGLFCSPSERVFSLQLSPKDCRGLRKPRKKLRKHVLHPLVGPSAGKVQAGQLAPTATFLYRTEFRGHLRTAAMISTAHS